MPVINSGNFPLFFRTKVYKRKKLLTEERKNAVPPVIKTRNLASVWGDRILFTGEMKSTRSGIIVLTFIVEKEPIVIWNGSWAIVNSILIKESFGEHYTQDIASPFNGVTVSRSIYQTSLLSEVVGYVKTSNDVPREFRDTILKLNGMAAISSSNGKVRALLSEGLKNLPNNIRRDILKPISKISKVSNPEALARSLMNKLKPQIESIIKKTSAETIGKDIINKNVVVKTTKDITSIASKAPRAAIAIYGTKIAKDIISNKKGNKNGDN